MVRTLTTEQRKRLSQCSACDISDALLSIGYPHGGLLPDLKFQLSTKKSLPFFGPAFTVKMVEASDKTSPSLDGHYADLVPEGAVLVIQAARHLKNACFGGLIAERVKIRAAAGVVVDGNIRDIADCESLSMPVFSRGLSTLGQKPFVRASAAGVPLEIQPQYAFTLTSEEAAKQFPSCTINSGEDVVFADENGVVVIGGEDLDQVLGLVEEIVQIDARVKDDIVNKSSDISEAFKKHRKPAKKA